MSSHFCVHCLGHYLGLYALGVATSPWCTSWSLVRYYFPSGTEEVDDNLRDTVLFKHFMRCRLPLQGLSFPFEDSIRRGMGGKGGLLKIVTRPARDIPS